MATSRKYEIGQVYDGYWELVAIEKGVGRKYRYTLKNQYNGKEVIVHGPTMLRIASGESSVSKCVAYRLRVAHESGRINQWKQHK